LIWTFCRDKTQIDETIVHHQNQTIMKKEFSNCSRAIKWITQNAGSEAAFQAFRQELDFHHAFTGEFFIYICEQEIRANLQRARR
jgi:hypothetical protein